MSHALIQYLGQFCLLTNVAFCGCLLRAMLTGAKCLGLLRDLVTWDMNIYWSNWSRHVPAWWAGAWWAGPFECAATGETWWKIQILSVKSCFTWSFSVEMDLMRHPCSYSSTCVSSRVSQPTNVLSGNSSNFSEHNLINESVGEHKLEFSFCDHCRRIVSCQVRGVNLFHGLDFYQIMLPQLWKINALFLSRKRSGAGCFSVIGSLSKCKVEHISVFFWGRGVIHVHGIKWTHSCLNRTTKRKPSVSNVEESVIASDSQFWQFGWRWVKSIFAYLEKLNWTKKKISADGFGPPVHPHQLLHFWSLPFHWSPDHRSPSLSWHLGPGTFPDGAQTFCPTPALPGWTRPSNHNGQFKVRVALWQNDPSLDVTKWISPPPPPFFENCEQEKGVP